MGDRVIDLSAPAPGGASPLPSALDLVIIGVGGQGSLLASRVLGEIVVEQGWNVTIGETLGLSQRGGTVVSQIRIARTERPSPVIAEGRADLIVALEPVEGLRALVRFGNPEIHLVMNTRPILPTGVLSGDQRYPDRQAIVDAARGLCGRLTLVDASDVALRLGQARLTNLVMLGALGALDALPVPLDREALSRVLGRVLPEHQVAPNLEAFDEGAAAISSSRTP
jgi:indolepyruvate ferredoxin oxidoreductase beta subunit